MLHQRPPDAPAPIFRIDRQHVDINRIRGQIFEFQNRNEHFGHVGGDWLRFFGQSVKDHAAGDDPVQRRHHRIAPVETDRGVAGTFPSVFPRILPLRRRLLPEVQGHAFARQIYQSGEVLRIFRFRRTDLGLHEFLLSRNVICSGTANGRDSPCRNTGRGSSGSVTPRSIHSIALPIRFGIPSSGSTYFLR
jgi:hypothetical protein